MRSVELTASTRIRDAAIGQHGVGLRAIADAAVMVTWFAQMAEIDSYAS